MLQILFQLALVVVVLGWMDWILVVVVVSGAAIFSYYSTAAFFINLLLGVVRDDDRGSSFLFHATPIHSIASMEFI